MTEPLFEMSAEIPDLKLLYHGRELANPHRIVTRIASRGREDIKFYKDQPMTLDVGTSIIDILAKSFSNGAPALETRIDDTKLQVGPGPSYLIRKGETIIFTILTDNPAESLKCEFPFENVIDRVPDNSDPRWLKNFIVAVFVDYMLTLIFSLIQSHPAHAFFFVFLYFLLIGLVITIISKVAILIRRRLDR